MPNFAPIMHLIQLSKIIFAVLLRKIVSVVYGWQSKVDWANVVIMPYLRAIGQPVAEILRFSNGRSGSEGQCALSCQSLCRSDKLFRRYRHFSIFKIAAIPLLVFLKVRTFQSSPVRRANVRHRDKFQTAVGIWLFFEFSR